MRKTAVLAAASFLAALVTFALVPSEPGSGAYAAAGASIDCGDSVGLPFRCVVAHAYEIAPAMELMRGGGADPATITIAAWTIGEDGQVTDYVIAGYFPNEPQPIK